MLSKEQFLELRKKGLSVDQIIRFERGEKPDGQPVSFAEEQPAEEGWGTKVKNFATDVIGGKFLAKGLGMALGAGEVQENLSGGQQGLYDQQDKTIAALRSARESGQDTSKLVTQMRNLQGDIRQQSGTQKSFEQEMPTNKQVIGSTARLMTTMAAPTLGQGFTGGLKSVGPTLAGGSRYGGVAQLTGLNTAKGFLQGAGRGAMAGAIEGGVGGGIVGGALAAEQNQDASGIATGAAIGGVLGAGIGAPLGAVGGGIYGRRQYNQSHQSVLDKVTPRTTDLSPEEYKDALSRKMITPATKTSPAQFNIKKETRDVALRHSHLMEKDPVRTTQNLIGQIQEYDDEVGKFLKKNRFKVGLGNLQQDLKEAMREIDDVNIDEKRLEKLKTDLVQRFIASTGDGYTDTIWKARKNYDREIEAAFSGSPNVQKEVKIALRNVVQDFLSTATPGDFYASKMKDMHHLNNLVDLVSTKAVKERGLNSLQKIFHDNPELKRAAPWIMGAAGAYVGGYLWQHSRSDTG